MLRPGAAILDLGCGHGVPISQALLESGFELYGVDASRSLVEEFRRRFPRAHVAHEAVEDSAFFNRTFNAVVAVGLMFLLSPDVQEALVHRVASVLHAGGRFLFTAPEQACSWVTCSPDSGRTRWAGSIMNAWPAMWASLWLPRIGTKATTIILTS